MGMARRKWSKRKNKKIKKVKKYLLAEEMSPMYLIDEEVSKEPLGTDLDPEQEEYINRLSQQRLERINHHKKPE